MSLYAVVYVDRATAQIESVVARAMEWHTADRMAGSMQSKARDGFFFAVRSDVEVDQ